VAAWGGWRHLGPLIILRKTVGSRSFASRFSGATYSRTEVNRHGSRLLYASLPYSSSSPVRVVIQMRNTPERLKSKKSVRPSKETAECQSANSLLVGLPRFTGVHHLSKRRLPR
jgi:hypothetical protein